ncbi:peptidylprolyl isomerase [Arthrobacter sp. Sr24]
MHNPQAKPAASANSKKMVLLIVGLIVALVIIVAGGVALMSKTGEGSDQEAVGATAATAPDLAKAEGREWRGTLEFNGAELGVTLFGDKAPQAVASFLHLAQTDFFVDTKCHRLTTGGFDILQCGDPTGTGTGGPGYEFGPVENAPENNVYKRGTLAMARTSNPNSNGSQFFIVYGDTTIGRDAAGGYTVMGEITSGLEAVESVAEQGTTSGAQDGEPVAPAVLGAAHFE